jgi:hypothetical protein
MLEGATMDTHLYLLTTASFLFVAFGGLFVGAIGGIVTALLTRLTGGYRSKLIYLLKYLCFN